MPMKICLLGATGFLGRSIGKRLSALGVPWVGISRSRTGPNTFVIPLENTLQLTELINEYPVVINALGSLKPGDFIRDSLKAQSQFLQALEQLEKLLSSSRIERIVHISSAGTVYGEALERPSTEEDCLHPKSGYGHAKVMEELRLSKIASKKGFAYVCARVSNPYGNLWASNHGFLDVLINCIRSGKYFQATFPMGATRDFIHSAIMAEMVVTLAISNDEGVFNIGRGLSTSLSGILELAEKLRPDAKIIRRFSANFPDVVHSAISIDKYLSRFGQPQTIAPTPEEYIVNALSR